MKPHVHVALALIWRDGEVLITRRRADAEHLANAWEFPGGKCFVDEAPAQAAVREAREEVGLSVEVVGARAVIEWEYEARRVTLYPFDCRVLAGEARALEVADWKWAAPGELREDEFPDANEALIRALRSSTKGLAGV